MATAYHTQPMLSVMSASLRFDRVESKGNVKEQRHKEEQRQLQK
jgi:hypothetical protein